MPGAHKTFAWFVVVALAGALIWGLTAVVRAPVASGEVYPPYSTFRADPLGAKALYESLARLPELHVSRSFKERPPITVGTTIFVLGLDPVAWVASPKQVFQEAQKLVENGGRLVIGLTPVRAPGHVPKTEAIEMEWHLHPTFERSEHEDSKDAMPRETALRLAAGDEWRELGDSAVERDFGKGTVVVAMHLFPLSNQGLVELRDTDAIAQLAGGSANLVFDESQFGVVDSGSVGTLIRKYRLEGALAVLAIAAGLFLWRAGSNFPPVAPPRQPDVTAGRNADEGMAALLRRGIPEQELLRTCFTLWSGSSAAPQQVERARNAMQSHPNVVEGYRAISRAIAERT
jgi:hypothetical protein